MSAIAGVFYRDGRPASADDLQPMIRELSYRCPDGTGCAVSGPVAMFHGLLRTIEETGPQPVRSGTRLLTGDVRLDNRPELLAELGLGQETKDEAIVLHAQERWGGDFADHLEGDFAVAIWNSQTGRLDCAVDAFAVRQFHYVDTADRFLFATEVRALMAMPGVAADVDEEAFARLSRADFSEASRTLFQSVRRLSAAQQLGVTADTLEVRPYWTPVPRTENLPTTPGEWAEEYRRIFTRAVTDRLRGPLRPGAMLSGGLDSSAIACVARDLLQEADSGPLATFSARFRLTPSCDEGPWIDSVLGQGGFEPFMVDPEQPSTYREWISGAETLDQPVIVPNGTVQWSAMECATSAGVGVILDGFGGDGVVSHGLGAISEKAMNGHVLSAVSDALSWATLAHQGRWTAVRSRVVAPIIPPWAKSVRRRVLRRGSGNPTPYQSELDSHLLELLNPIADYARMIIDRTAAFHQREVRMPFWDRRLVAFCLAVPVELRFSKGLGRALVRQALADTLPALVRTRGSKGDLSASFVRMAALDTGPQTTHTFAAYSRRMVVEWRAKLVKITTAEEFRIAEAK